jgi:hypothetical protein
MSTVQSFISKKSILKFCSCLTEKFFVHSIKILSFKIVISASALPKCLAKKKVGNNKTKLKSVASLEIIESGFINSKHINSPVKSIALCRIGEKI